MWGGVCGGGEVSLNWKQNGHQQDGGQVDKCSVCVAFYNISSRVSCLISFVHVRAEDEGLKLLALIAREIIGTRRKASTAGNLLSIIRTW